MSFYKLSLATTLSALLLTACGSDKPADTTTSSDANSKGERTLTIATEANYPPFNNLTANGAIVGFDIDVINAVCAEMNATCNIVAQDWEGLLPGLMANKYDAVIAGMSITPERLEQVDFSEPYFSNTIIWLAKNDGSFDPNNIKNAILSSQRGVTGADYITKHFDGKDGNRVQLYDTYTNAYLDLKAGRNHAVMAEKVSANDWLAQGNTDFGLIGEEIDNNDHLGIAVRKGDALKTDIDKALATLKANGKLAELEKAVFGGSATTSNATNEPVADTTTEPTSDDNTQTNPATTKEQATN